MPLTKKGSKILSSMVGEYGPKKGEQVFVCSVHDTLTLLYDSTNDRWLEVSRSVN